MSINHISIFLFFFKNIKTQEKSNKHDNKNLLNVQLRLVTSLTSWRDWKLLSSRLTEVSEYLLLLLLLLQHHCVTLHPCCCYVPVK